MARPNRTLLVLYVLLSAASLGLLVGAATGALWKACSGGLGTFVLPAGGGILYAALALLASRSPQSPWLALAPCLYVFVHAALVVETLRAERPCAGCLAVAALAAFAAIVQARRSPPESKPVAAALLLGIVAGFLSPFERLDDTATRLLWPARMLEVAPAWVSREEMSRCPHPSAVRVLLFEKDCRTCSSAANRIVPKLTRDYPTQVCVHLHNETEASSDRHLPLFILISRQARVVVIEGFPRYEEMGALLDQMMK